MNILFVLGILMIIGYSLGFLCEKIGLPKIIGYIITGIVLSPYSFDFISHDIIESTEPLIDASLAFIAFEVGGSLDWKNLRNYGKRLLNILLFESLSPFFLVILVLGSLGYIFPHLFPFGTEWLLILAILIAPLGSPTDPTATLAVMHQYKARGKVSDTIMQIAALDDAMGIFLFSVSVSAASIIVGSQGASIGMSVLNALYQIIGALIAGGILGFITKCTARIFKVKEEGQWIVVLIAFVILTFGIASMLNLDELLAAMALGAYTTNFNRHKNLIFAIVERYTEELIFLFFFILSGLHMDVTAIPGAAYLIIIFVLLRVTGKTFGSRIGAYLGGSSKAVQKYTAGGLIPQGGIVIGLALLISKNPDFSEISHILIAVVMGSAVIHEIIGPITAKMALKKAGEIEEKKQN